MPKRPRLARAVAGGLAAARLMMAGQLKESYRMLFHIEAAALKAALLPFAKVIEPRNTIPILSHILIRADGDGLHLIGTNLDWSLKRDVLATIDRPGAICLPFAALADLVKRADPGAFVTVASDTGERATVTAGRACATLACLSPFDFPTMFEPRHTVASVSLPLAQFVHDVARVGTAMSTEETCYYLNGFLMARRADGSGLDMAATDGHRLVWIARPDAGLPDAWPVNDPIFPRGAVPAFAALAGKKPAGDVSVQLLGAVIDAKASPARDDKPVEAIEFAGDGWRLLVKAIDGTFPDFRRVVPAACYDPVTIAGDDLATVAARVAPGKCNQARGLALSMSRDRVQMIRTCPDNGVRAEELPAAYPGGPDGAQSRGCGFNGAYLAGLGKLAGGGVVQLGGQDASAPWLALYPDSPEMLAVLMPMRTGGAEAGNADSSRAEPWPAAFIDPPEVVARRRLRALPEMIEGRFACRNLLYRDKAKERAAIRGMVQELRQLRATAEIPPAGAPEAPAVVQMPADAGIIASGPDIAPAPAIPADDLATTPPTPADLPPPAPVPVPAGYPIPHAPAVDAVPADDLAATVAGLVATVAALQARLDALGGDAGPLESQATPPAPADDLAERLATTEARADALAAELAGARLCIADQQMRADRCQALAESWESSAMELCARRDATAARLRSTRAALASSRSDAAAALALASEGESRLADALQRLAVAERSRADLAAALARTRAQSPLAGLRYINPPHAAERFQAAA